MDLELYSLAQKTKLLSRTRVLVGAHGAGLTNLLFSPRAALLEIFPGRVVTANYTALAGSLGQAYGCIKSLRDEDGHARVDVEHVIQAIETL